MDSVDVNKAGNFVKKEGNIRAYLVMDCKESYSEKR